MANGEDLAVEQTSLEELARRAQRGDERALGRLLGECRPYVYRWAIVHTSSADDAEDIAQQTLLRVHAKVCDFAFASKFTSWLHVVTRSVAAEWLRTRHRRARLLAANPPNPLSDTAAFQPAGVSHLERIVREQLGSLPARQREAFDLIDLQGYTPAEAAELLGMNANTTRVHVMRARRAIRTRLLAQSPVSLDQPG
jgi:RNA polymerase sigma-70 factor, ECF subfamily